MADGPIKVLIADDDARFLDSLRALIDRQPELSVVGAAANGLEAIELADAFEVDAAVVDLHMPLLDGVTTVARLRGDHPHLCLIVLTGDADPELHRAASEAGADAVLEKHEMARALVDRLAGAALTRPAGPAGRGSNGEGRT
ncbi:MAG: response regulator transcription factor [Gaiellaceae bacterium]